MDQNLHFISGLPRAGSTLLAALLRQNPAVHAGMTSPVGSLFTVLLREMSQANESAVFLDDADRQAILQAMIGAYYRSQPQDGVVFDTNRLWCSKLPALAGLFPRARVICCVRHVPWIMDSMERLIRRNPFELSRIFNFEPGGTVYSRTEGLGCTTGMVGFAWNALREAWFGEEAGRLLVVTYETLTTAPQTVLDAVYDFIGAPRFAHDVNNVVYEEGREFDARMGTPGLHSPGRAVRPSARATILPPELFRKYEADSFWCEAGANPHGVPVI